MDRQLEKMQQDWDQRARENARYYVNTERSDWNDNDFFKSGERTVEGFFRGGRFGIGVGSLILTLNVVLIASYTFGCHSFRHLIGGRKDCMSDCGKPTLALGTWRKATWFNERHMQFAWLSLVWVMVTDLYVRLLSMGVIRDFNTW